MYEIYAYIDGILGNKLLVHRVGDAQYQVMNPKLTREVSKAGSLTFVMTRDHPQYDNLPKMRTIVSVHQDGKEIWRGRVLKHEADWLNRRTVYCEGALAFFNDSCITPFIYEGKLAEFLQNLLDIHNYQVYHQMKQFRLGTVSAALGDLIVRFGDGDEYGVGEDFGSIWEIISNLVLKTFGGYVWCTFDPDTGYNVLNYCDEAYEADRQTAQKIEYGQNLLDFVERTDTNNLMTRIYPVGNKHSVTETKWKWKILWWGEKYTESHEERYGIMGTDKATIEKYLPEGYTYDLTEGYIQSTVAAQKFGVVGKIMGFDTDSDNDTFAAGVQALQQNSAMKNSYTIKAVDLVDAGYNTDRLTFASFAHIRSVPHSIDAIMLCSKLVEPLDNPSKKEFTFGMNRRTLTDRQVANMGKTNLLQENAYASERYHQDMLKRLFAYKSSTDSKLSDISKGLSNAVVKMGDLQNQIDDNITSWFYAGTPTAANEPAKNWTTDAVKKQHIGDLYYDKLTGLGYRWVLDNGTYSWVVIRDTGVAKALADAAAAQATADGKVRCFGTTPAPPYDVGDIWMQGTGGDIMRCQTARHSGSYQAADWVKASKYTDDTAANQAKQDAAEAAKTATNFLEFTPQNGLIVRHDSLPGKRVQILNDGIRVMDGSSMVNIQSNAISITDGMGSCSISSGAITFNGIRNSKIFEWPYQKDSYGTPIGGFTAQTTKIDLSSYSSVMLVYDTHKGGTWFASGGSAGRLTVVLPVNGQTYSYAYPWNTAHWREVTVSYNGITFGNGNERTSWYIGLNFSLETPGGDGVNQNDEVCRPLELYGFM